MAEFDPRYRESGAPSTPPAGSTNVSLRRFLHTSARDADAGETEARRALTMDDIERRARERFPWQTGGEAPVSGREAHPTDPSHGAATEQIVPERAMSVATAAEPAPVLDLTFVLASTWRYRTAVLAAALVCALLGGAATMALSKKYSATVTLYFDPQMLAVQLVQGDRTTSPEVLNGTIDSQTQIIASRRVLESVATNLKLVSDPEFVGAASGDTTTDLNRAILALQKHTQISRRDGTYIFEVKVTTGAPEKSASIANALVAAYLTDSRATAETSFGSVNAGFNNQLPALRKALVAAEAEVRDFTSRNDLFSVGGNQIADKRLQSLDDLLVAAQRKIIEAKAQLDTVSNLDISDVIVDDAGASRTLGDLRNQYASLSANVSSLTDRLGPRHPQLQSAKASLADIEKQISLELQRLVTAARGAYEAAQKEEADLLKELNVQKATQATNASALIELSELQRKAKAARDVYEAVLKRSEETAAEMSLYSSNIRILAEAIPPQAPDGPSRRALVMAGVFGGGLFGLGLAMVAAVGFAFYRRIVQRS